MPGWKGVVGAGWRTLPLWLLVGAGLSLVPQGSGSLPCEPLAPALHALDDLQNDAGIGRDASDVAADADRLGLVDEMNPTGFLDAPVAHDAADLEDWYEVVLAGTGEVVRANVTPSYAYPASAVPVLVYLRIEAWGPGDTKASAAATTGTDILFENDRAGLWHFRVLHADPIGEPLCGSTSSAGGPDGLSPAPLEALDNYVFYLGCNPVCVDAP